MVLAVCIDGNETGDDGLLVNIETTTAVITDMHPLPSARSS